MHDVFARKVASSKRWKEEREETKWKLEWNSYSILQWLSHWLRDWDGKGIETELEIISTHLLDDFFNGAKIQFQSKKLEEW